MKSATFMRGIKPKAPAPQQLTLEQSMRIWQLSRGGSQKGESPNTKPISETVRCAAPKNATEGVKFDFCGLLDTADDLRSV